MLIKKVISLYPDNKSAYFGLGLLQHEMLNQPDEAEQSYRHSIHLNPGIPDSYFQLGLLLHEHYHRYEEAEAMFLKTLELNPQDETASFNVACIRAIMRDTESAFTYLRDAIQNGFDKAWVWDDPELECLHDDPRFIQIAGPRPIDK